MNSRVPVVLAVDPGRGKCGMAVVDRSEVAARGVVPIDRVVAAAVGWAREFGIHTIVLGNRTAAEDVEARLAAALPAATIVKVDEAGTTEAARRRYFAEHPPRGWRRLIPLGMQVPPEPYDDYVAVMLAERFLGILGPGRGAPKRPVVGRPGRRRRSPDGV